jgi:NADH-quinone oxidoreductase subunit B
VDWAIDWARRSALWTTICFPACCAFEFIATAASRFDISRFGMEIMRASPRQADLMITAGTLTWKMAPQVKRIYDQMPEPKWVIAMGACACSGGIFANSYAVVPGLIASSLSTHMFRLPTRPVPLYGIQPTKKIAKEHVTIKIPTPRRIEL